jgi:hypothetical protein
MSLLVHVERGENCGPLFKKLINLNAAVAVHHHGMLFFAVLLSFGFSEPQSAIVATRIRLAAFRG